MIPLKASVISRSSPTVNRSLIGINVFVYLLEVIIGPELRVNMFYALGVVPQHFALLFEPGGSAYGFGLLSSLFTHFFMHGSLAHLVGNMWTLHIFGRAVEDRMGHLYYLVFYCVCGVLSALCHIFFELDSTIPALGASGAISGVMGAYLWMFPRSTIMFLIPWIVPIIFIPSFLYLGFWFLGQFIQGYTSNLNDMSAGIAFWAHIGGFVAGSLLHKSFIRWKKRHIHDPYHSHF